MLEPLVVIPAGKIVTGMGAAAFCARLGRNHGGQRHFHQIVEFQRFHPRGIEYSALVPDLSVPGALRPLRRSFPLPA